MAGPPGYKRQTLRTLRVNPNGPRDHAGPVFDPERDARYALRVAHGSVPLAIAHLERLAGPVRSPANGWLQAVEWLRERS